MRELGASGTAAAALTKLWQSPAIASTERPSSTQELADHDMDVFVAGVLIAWSLLVMQQVLAGARMHLGSVSTAACSARLPYCK